MIIEENEGIFKARLLKKGKKYSVIIIFCNRILKFTFDKRKSAKMFFDSLKDVEEFEVN